MLLRYFGQCGLENYFFFKNPGSIQVRMSTLQMRNRRKKIFIICDMNQNTHTSVAPQPKILDADGIVNGTNY